MHLFRITKRLPALKLARQGMRSTRGAIYQNLVQFAPTAALGQPTKGAQVNTLAVRFLASSSAVGVQVGSPMMLVASAAPEIVVDLWTSASGVPVFGVIPLNTKKNKYSPGDVIDLFTDGNILLLEATAAVNRGDNLTISNTAAVGGGPGVTTATVPGTQLCGQALTQTSAGQQLVAVRLRNGSLASAGTVVASGTFVANGATPVVVAQPALTLTGIVLISLNTIGGTPAGQPYLSASTPGTGFSVKAFAGDTSTYNYRIMT